MPAAKHQMIIQSITGHGTARGIPEAFEITLEHADGSVLRARMPAPTGDKMAAGVLPHRVRFLDFGCCPICLAPEAGSREHVPPRAVGGTALTMTCEPCNNEFGSKYEPSLLAWYERSLGRRAYISGGSVAGSRRVGELLVRETEGGALVLFETGSSHPDIDEMLRSGAFSIEYVPLDPKAAHIAAVKSAYLAACVFLKEVPDTPQATAIRAELIQVRDRRRGAEWEISPLLQSIRKLQSGEVPTPGEIRLVHIKERDGSRTLAISFNRAFAVEWPLEASLGEDFVEQWV